ncbi:hypothetical protein BHE74_00034227 [Ensete ventricosum]|nr:hypothetical protein BHE74_00034227 [Ensete ventricosum]
MELEELRRGPWTAEEDLVLVEHVTEHGEGRWNALARRAGTYLDEPIRVVLIELYDNAILCITGIYLVKVNDGRMASTLSPSRPRPPLSLGKSVSYTNLIPTAHINTVIYIYIYLSIRYVSCTCMVYLSPNRWSKIARYLPNRWTPCLPEPIHAAYCGFLSSSYVGPIAAPGRPPPPYSFGQPEQAIAPCTETAASTSSKDSLPTTAQGDGMIQRGEEMLGVDGGGGGWAESQLPCPLNYDELGWESEDLLSGDYLWTTIGP